MSRSRISFQQAVAVALAVSALWSSAVQAEEVSATTVQKGSALIAPVNLPWQVAERRASVLSLIEREAQRNVLPFELADAVAFVESAYLQSAVGKAGEIGLMQIMPSTAAMLGFAGSMTQLAEPETNIRYGVEYLAIAWRLTGGDLCRTLMKYRAGHGSDVISARSAEYCRRARKHLAALVLHWLMPVLCRQRSISLRTGTARRQAHWQAPKDLPYEGRAFGQPIGLAFEPSRLRCT